MGQGSSGSVPTPPPGEGNSEIKHVLPGPEPATQPLPTNPVRPSYQPVTDPGPPPTVLDAPDQSATIVGPRRPGAAGVAQEPPPGGLTAAPPPGGLAAPPPPGGPAAVPRPGGLNAAPPGGVPPEVVRYGPGVPVGRAGAESVWRTGQRAGAGVRRGGRGRVRRVAGAVVTVVLLAAAGVVVWLRFFDHPPLRVTGVGIIQQAAAGCTVDVTGRISTNGSAGTVSYQWVFRPQAQAPRPLDQSVVAGQRAVYVTVAVQGQGHGTASQTVTLDVLGPDTGTASRDVTVSC